MTSFVNILGLKQLTVMAFVLLNLLVWAIKEKGSRRLLLVYNLFSPMSLPTIVAAWLTRSTAVVLVADTPHGDYCYKGAKGILERLDYWFQTRVVKCFSGIICLNNTHGLILRPTFRALWSRVASIKTKLRSQFTGLKSHEGCEFACIRVI